MTWASLGGGAVAGPVVAGAEVVAYQLGATVVGGGDLVFIF